VQEGSTALLVVLANGGGGKHLDFGKLEDMPSVNRQLIMERIPHLPIVLIDLSAHSSTCAFVCRSSPTEATTLGPLFRTLSSSKSGKVPVSPLSDASSTLY